MVKYKLDTGDAGRSDIADRRNYVLNGRKPETMVEKTQLKVENRNYFTGLYKTLGILETDKAKQDAKFQSLKIKGKIHTFDAGSNLKLRDPDNKVIGSLTKGTDVTVLQREKRLFTYKNAEEMMNSGAFDPSNPTNLKEQKYFLYVKVGESKAGWVPEEFVKFSKTEQDAGKNRLAGLLRKDKGERYNGPGLDVSTVLAIPKEKISDRAKELRKLIIADETINTPPKIALFEALNGGPTMLNEKLKKAAVFTDERGMQANLMASIWVEK